MLVVVSFTTLDWLRGGLALEIGRANAGSTFAGIHHTIGSVRAAFAVAGESGALDTGIAGSYFAWLGWTLAGACAVLTGAALVTDGAPGIVVRVLAVTVGLLGVGCTFWAIVVVRYGTAVAQLAGLPSPGYGSYLSHAAAGFYCAVAGFALFAAAPAAGGRARLVWSVAGAREA